MLQVGMVQVGVIQVGVIQVGVVQVGVVEVGALQNNKELPKYGSFINLVALICVGHFVSLGA